MPADLFESAYVGTPPWDIGRSQPAIMKLAETGQITGLVLDIGCGTGENVLYLAEHGFVAAGLEGAPTPVRKARGTAKPGGLQARFELAAPLRPPLPPQPIYTLICLGVVSLFPCGDPAHLQDC